MQKYLKENLANISAGLVCLLAVPVLMASQEWDDHDRSKKTLAVDLAKDYLESCAPNAILFSFGDNDTYPLWYAQEVEGIRKDIRVINYSLLGIDWYINQLRYKVNESDSIDVIWSREQIEGSKRDYIRYVEKQGVSELNRYVDLYSLMKDFIGSDEPNNQVAMSDGSSMNFYPVKKVSVPVDTNFVRANHTVNADDSVVSALRFEISKNVLMKNDMAVLNIIAANRWKRPIYFTSPGSQGMGFDNYLRNDGMAYRLVPVLTNQNNAVNGAWAYQVMKEKFMFGNAKTQGVYFDEENRRHLISIRMAYADVASNLVSKGKNKEANVLLEKVDAGMSDENMPYGMVSRGNQHDIISVQMADAAFKAGNLKLASKIVAKTKKDVEEQLNYYANLGGMSALELRKGVQDIMESKGDNLTNRQKNMFSEIRVALGLKDYLDNMERMYQTAPTTENPANILNK